MGTMPVVEKDTYKRRRPLKFQTGAEVASDFVLDYSVVSQDATGRRLVNAGTLCTKITATSKYGPYDSAASDGRQTLTKGSAMFTTAGYDLGLACDKAVAGYIHNCVFDTSELTILEEGRYTKSSVPSAVTDAFPTCTFED